jgi:hypothetical protein
MVRVGGCLIWADYLWSHPDVPMLSPKRAIDTWLATRWKFVEVIFAERQVCPQAFGSPFIGRYGLQVRGGKVMTATRVVTSI